MNLKVFRNLLKETQIRVSEAESGGRCLELLQDFTELPIREELTEWLKGNDYNNYCIRIHGFKNNAYSVGAKELGDFAFAMEKSTREGFPENVEELQETLLQ